MNLSHSNYYYRENDSSGGIRGVACVIIQEALNNNKKSTIMRKLRICQEVEDNTSYNGTTRAGHNANNPLLFQECYIDEQNGVYSSDQTILFAPPVNVKEYVINEKTERIIIPAQKGSILQSLIIKRRAWK